MNAVWGGYAVGVAGLVGFIPAKQCARPTARRIGQLQKFRILEVRARNVLRLTPFWLLQVGRTPGCIGQLQQAHTPELHLWV